MQRPKKTGFFRCLALTLFCLGWIFVSSADTGRAAEAQKPSAYIVAFGMFGAQSVFDSEARAGAKILADYFQTLAPPLVRTNTKTTSEVTSSSLIKSMQSARRALKRDRDILVLFLTSHGAPKGIAVQGRRQSGLLTPPSLGQLLRMSGARYRIVIVSACFSGLFADKLADRNTLVITAAASDRTSFGCEDRVAWTYFGEAFFQKSLRPGRPLAGVFAEAKGIVEAREKAEHLTPPSNPQFRGGEAVLKLLGQ